MFRRTLVSFAVDVASEKTVISPELKKGGEQAGIIPDPEERVRSSGL